MSDPPATSNLPRDLPTWSDAAARAAVAGLPDPPKDEPASLRHDIHDELADHLACAFRRELLRGGGDVQRAHRAVLDRFGDPAAVARTLWFQAMQGKLMAQKLLIGVVCVAAAAAVGSTVVVWHMVQANQTTAAALLADSRTAQAALLERLAAAENRPAWSANPEWNPIVLRFVHDTPGQPPATDILAQVRGPYRDTSQQLLDYGERRPNVQGILDLAVGQTGKYYVTVKVPWGGVCTLTPSMTPGQPLNLTVVVPGPPPSVPLVPQIVWPKSLGDDEMWAVLGCNSLTESAADGQTWTLWEQRAIAVSRSGRVVDLAAYYQHAQNQPAWKSLVQRSSPPLDRGPVPRGWPSSAIRAAAGPWALDWIAVFPQPDLPDEPDELLLNAFAGQYQSNHRVNWWIGDGFPGYNAQGRRPPAVEQLTVLAPTRKVEATGTTAWRIDLPPSLATRLLEQFPTEKPANDAAEAPRPVEAPVPRGSAS